MNKPIVWTIAGFDSSGGAGAQADIQIINQLGAYACSILTALTAQNTVGIERFEPIDPNMFASQLHALQTDLPPTAIKLGMLCNKRIVDLLGIFLKENPPVFTVCDPILTSSSGVFLLEASAWKPLIENIFPVIDLLTPNLPETEQLFDLKIRTAMDVEIAAKKALACGVKEILIKGGHGKTKRASDYWSNGTHHAWISSPRQKTMSLHGTGCFLSSAITTARALGYDSLDSIVLAKAYLNQGIRQAPNLGHGCGPLAFNPWERSEQDLPSITQEADRVGSRSKFI